MPRPGPSRMEAWLPALRRERADSSRTLSSLVLLIVLIVLIGPVSSRVSHAAAAPSDAAVLARLGASDVEALKRFGPAVLPVLARLYESAHQTGDVRRRIDIANAFYQLGWESAEAKRALSADLGTPERELRTSVQYALGRVSGEDDVVDALLRTLRTDPSPYFRDKAACALSYDQIHLSTRGKVRLFFGLIAALGDAKFQIRMIAIQALEIHTGQRKGFDPAGSAEQRAQAIEEWRRWLYEYRAQL